MSIIIKDITKTFDNFLALNRVSLDIPAGELTALLGPSGSGKTTLLRIIAGLEAPDTGSVSFFGEDATHREVRERQVGFVFQHYALFRHMSVFENVAFGLKVRKRSERPSKEAIREKVLNLLKLVQLENFALRFPHELSGGQKQRVALARALAVEPKVLLLDEPFGALDAKVRTELRRWLRFLHDEINVTSVFVTHDQEEALEVADTVVILNKGKIEQVGSPEEVYDNPANPFVYSFLGNVNLFHARLERGKFSLSGEAADKFFIRPHDVRLSVSRESDSSLAANIVSHRVLGGKVRVSLKTVEGGRELDAEVDKKEWNAVKDADRVFVTVLGAKVYSANNEWSDYVI